MRKIVFLLAAAATLASCSKDEQFTCSQKVEKKVGADWVLINSGTWQGDYQFKNYTEVVWAEDGTFEVIRTTVNCN